MTLSTIHTFLAALPMSERLSLGLQVLVIGMATVFSVLIILWLVLMLFKLFAYTLPQKKNAKITAAMEQPSVTASTVTAADTSYAEDSSDEYEIVAAITAALEEYRASTGTSLPFRVVSFKRVKGANGWNGNDTNETI